MNKKVKKFDFSKINKESASENLKKFNSSVNSIAFQNKLMQYQITLEKKETAMSKKIERIVKRFEVAKDREAQVKSYGKVPVAIYTELLEGYNSISNGEAIIFAIAKRVERMEKELEKCSNDDQIDIVKRYHTTGFIEPLKVAKEVENFLQSRGFEINTKGLEEAEVISSKLLNETNEVSEQITA